MSRERESFNKNYELIETYRTKKFECIKWLKSSLRGEGSPSVLFFLNYFYLFYHYGSLRNIASEKAAAPCGYIRHSVYDLHPFRDFAEYGIAPALRSFCGIIQKIVIHIVYKKL